MEKKQRVMKLIVRFYFLFILFFIIEYIEKEVYNIKFKYE